MKISALSVLAATFAVSSCANIDYREDTQEDRKVDIGDYGDRVEYRDPTPHEELGVEERELTPEIISALDVDDAVSVLVFDSKGNIVEYIHPEIPEEPIIYPVDTSQIGNAYTSSYIWFKGSHCFDRTDSLGRAVRRCPSH